MTHAQFFNECDWRLQDIEHRFSGVEVSGRFCYEGSAKIKNLLIETETVLQVLIKRADQVGGKKVDKVKEDLEALLSTVKLEQAWWNAISVASTERARIINEIGFAIREIILVCESGLTGEDKE